MVKVMESVGSRKLSSTGRKMRPCTMPSRVITRFSRKKKIWMSCALANASTTIPGRFGVEFGAVLPGRLTALPMVAVASMALSTRVGSVLRAKDRGHDPHGIHGDHDDGEQVEQAGAQVQAEQDPAHHEGGQQAQGDVKQALRYNAQGKTSKLGSVPGTWRMLRVMLAASSRARCSAAVNSVEVVRGVWYAMNRVAAGGT
ncbi:hypothetical protein JZ751_004611 [Albula glossodonta]|uniref:Uncharacterized protein n=1 Tax=Albula glossodonta TaxID=121402 RepID=A0A8T2NCN8_9TELE|nr:hypothetical protein JZ751_004611 [Albula glossodonta]